MMHFFHFSLKSFYALLKFKLLRHLYFYSTARYIVRGQKMALLYTRIRKVLVTPSVLLSTRNPDNKKATALFREIFLNPVIADSIKHIQKIPP